MTRRYVGAGLMRRAARDPNLGSANPQTILGSLLVDWWDARTGVTLVSGAVQDWVGTKGTYTLSAIAAGQRPVFAADTTLFKSRPVIQTASATGKFLTTGILLGNIVPTTSNPWAMVVGRLRTAYTIAGVVRALSMTGPGVQSFDIEPGTANGTARNDGQGVGTSGDLALDTAPHVIETYQDATGKDSFAIDGMEATQGTAGGAAGNNLSFNLAAVDSLGNFVDDFNFASVILATAAPTAAQRTALRAWALAEWGVP